jgi:hypothetical protein
MPYAPTKMEATGIQFNTIQYNNGTGSGFLRVLRFLLPFLITIRCYVVSILTALLNNQLEDIWSTTIGNRFLSFL